MAMLDTFTVSSKGLCLLCLNDGNGKLQEKSMRRLVEYLELDHKKIFNITAATTAPVEDLVDVKIAVCKTCEDVANTFNGLWLDMEEIKKKMTSCVETMLEVMVNAESDFLLSRRYKQRMVGVPEGVKGGTKQESEAVKKTIPDKFRKETMLKSMQKVEKEREKEPRMPIDENIVEENSELELFQNGHPEDNHYSNDPSSSSDEDALKIDEDADPEELMMHYNTLAPGSSAQATTSALSGFLSNSIWEDDSTELDKTSGNSSSDSALKSTFNSKYQCKICDKVVVSLKNFELHQRRHSGEKPFSCPFCEQHFRDTSNLRSHTLRYHRHYLFTKFQDPRLNLDQFKLALDKIVHSIVRVVDGSTASHQSHQCFICSKEYTQKYAIEDHIVQRHYDVLSTALITLQTDTPNYQPQDIAEYLVKVNKSGAGCTRCGLCNQSFETAEEVNAHMKVHVRVKVARNSVNSTPEDSTDSSSLIQLKMKCNACSRSFQDLSALKKHKILHRGNCVGPGGGRDSVYSCEHCGRTFCSYYSQRSHVLSFHRYEVFSQYLPESTTPEQIETVVKGITGRYTKVPSGLYQCSLCAKEITQLRKLQSHMLVTHFDKVVETLKAKLGKGAMPKLQYQGNGFAHEEVNFEAEFDESMDSEEYIGAVGGMDASAMVEVAME